MNLTMVTATVCNLRDIFAQHGLLELLVSDNASNFTVEEFEIFMRKNGMVHIRLLHTIVHLMALQKVPYRS